MAYISGPYGSGDSVIQASPDTRAKLSSSRSIDPKTMRYVIADDGGFEAMDDVAQDVLLAVAFVKTNEGRIDPKQQEKTKQALRLALKPLSDGPEPRIKVVDIIIRDDGRETTYTGITYTNLLTNTLNTVEP